MHTLSHTDTLTHTHISLSLSEGKVKVVPVLNELSITP
jgi:hypothetical protein